MNRRRFFELLGMGVSGIALEQAIPFNRVWSFPKDIILAKQDSLRDGFLTNRIICALNAKLAYDTLSI
jgi:hypothetical protein